MTTPSPKPPVDLAPRSATTTERGGRFRAGVEQRLAPIRHVLSQPAIVSVLLIVLAFNVAVHLESVQHALPMIQQAQLSFHQWLCSVAPRAVTPKLVRLVEIDDAAHLKLGEPTDRAFLAKLVTNAARGGAAVVVLDIKLLAPEGMSNGEDVPERAAQNAALLGAAREAASRGTPVVLTTWLKRESHEFSRMPNVFADAAFERPDENGRCPAASGAPARDSSGAPVQPACVRIGNINLPVDKRRIPLVTVMHGTEEHSESLALAAANAYEEVIDRTPRTREKPAIAHALGAQEFVYGSFVAEDGFQTIPIFPLAEGDDHALRLCRGRIVLVGGTWRSDLGHGEPVDSYMTPVGRMRGMYLHANYIEALLDDRYSPEVPLAVALLFDFGAGLWLYVRFHQATEWRAQLRLLFIPAVLLVISYVVFANLNLYLDFILPLGAYFVHLAVEYVRDYGRLRSVAVQPAPEAGIR